MNSKKYVTDLVDVAVRHKVDYFIPVSSPIASLYDSQAKPLLENIGCRVLHFDENLTKILDNKHDFCEYARSIGLNTPDTFCAPTETAVSEINGKLKSIGGVKKFILKNLQYDPIHRLDMFKLPCCEEKLETYLRKIAEDGNPITEDAPWQVQQFIEGKESVLFLAN